MKKLIDAFVRGLKTSSDMEKRDIDYKFYSRVDSTVTSCVGAAILSHVPILNAISAVIAIICLVDVVMIGKQLR